MIKFKWKYITSSKEKKYISWEAKWDGCFDNDPLVGKEEISSHEGTYEVLGHPFRNTIDYEESDKLYQNYKNMTEKERKEEWVVEVQQTDGSIKKENWGNLEYINPEDYNPKFLRKCSDVVAVNSVTRELCDMLSDDEKIIAGSGHTHPFQYRSKLLGCLSLLWD